MFYSYAPMSKSHVLNVRAISTAIVLMLVAMNPLFPSGVGAAGGASAQQVFTVDLQKVIDQATIAQSARTDLQSEMKKREGALAEKRGAIEKLKADLQKQVSLLSSAAVAERQEAITKRERELAADFEAQRDELGRKSDAQMRKIFAQIDVVLAELAKDKDNAIIIERDPRLVLYAAPALDITPEVVKRLNLKKLG